MIETKGENGKMAPRFKSSEPGKEGLSPEREDFPGFLSFEKSYVS